MINNTKLGRIKVVATSFGTSAAVVLLLGAVFVFGAGEPLSSGYNSSGQFGIATTSPGSNLSVFGTANLGMLSVETSVKASSVIATSSLVVRNGAGGIRLKDSDGNGCHGITVNSAGTITATEVDCEAGFIALVSDNFDSASSTLTGNNYGAGWSGAWQAGATASFVVATTSCYSGNCIKGSGASEMDNIRSFTNSMTDGTLSFKMKSVIGSGVSSGLQAKVGGNIAFTVQATSDGGDIIRLIAGSTQNLLTSYTSGAWYTIDVEFGDNGGSGTCNANQARARLNGGTWSGCVNYSNNGALTGITPQYSNNTGTEFWVDNIVFTQ